MTWPHGHSSPRRDRRPLPVQTQRNGIRPASSVRSRGMAIVAVTGMGSPGRRSEPRGPPRARPNPGSLALPTDCRFRRHMPADSVATRRRNLSQCADGRTSTALRIIPETGNKVLFRGPDRPKRRHPSKFRTKRRVPGQHSHAGTSTQLPSPVPSPAAPAASPARPAAPSPAAPPVAVEVGAVRLPDGALILGLPACRPSLSTFAGRSAIMQTAYLPYTPGAATWSSAPRPRIPR